jgi:hypothetical protein
VGSGLGDALWLFVVGLTLGIAVGSIVVGLRLGIDVGGAELGLALGDAVGMRVVGPILGHAVGVAVVILERVGALLVGLIVGVTVRIEGVSDTGAFVGELVGFKVVGVAVGE